MPTYRQVTIACGCDTRIRLTVKPGHEGKRVTVRCPSCGQGLRVRLPEAPKRPHRPEDDRPMEEILRDLSRTWSRTPGGNPFGV